MKTCLIHAIWRLVLASVILAFSAGVHADDVFLRNWKVAAKHGNVNAQYSVASYYIARGINKEGIEWYTMAAENGHARAQYELADMFMEGKKVQKSFVRAVYWYRKSAENGYQKAQAKLGIMYVHGGMVEKDPVQAYRWLRLAVVNGNLEAADELNELVDRMTWEQIDAAELLIAGDKDK